MHYFFALIPSSKIEFHIRIACLSIFMLVFLPIFRLWLYFCGVEWLQELWFIEIKLENMVEIYQLQTINFLFSAFVAFVEICTIKRKWWAYVANITILAILFMSTLVNFLWIGIGISTYALFVFTQKSSGAYFGKIAREV